MNEPKTCPDCGTLDLHQHSFEECCVNLVNQLDEAIAERDALRAERDALRTVAAFFPSGAAGSAVIERLMNAPYGHFIRRDNAGNSHVSLYQLDGTLLHTIVAPTFDEAVTKALDLAALAVQP